MWVGLSCFLSSGDGYVGELLELQQGLEGPFGSLEGKPRGKPRGKVTDPLIHAKGSVTLLLQLGRKAHVHATIPRVPQMSQSIPGKPVFPALPRLSSRESTHTTVARGKALWERLVGKPPGKASRESHRSLDPREGKCDTAATTAREESARA